MLRKEDWMMIQALKKRGVYQTDIAAELGVHPKTVSRALKRDGPPEGKRRRRGSKLDPYKAQVDQLLAVGVVGERRRLAAHRDAVQPPFHVKRLGVGQVVDRARQHVASLAIAVAGAHPATDPGHRLLVGRVGVAVGSCRSCPGRSPTGSSCCPVRCSCKWSGSWPPRAGQAGCRQPVQRVIGVGVAFGCGVEF